jgi:tRNA G10  N-methylase Trm11
MDAAPRLTAHAAVVEDPDWNGAELMDRLGGTVKLGDIVLSCPTEELDENRLAAICAERPMGDDVSFGLSVIGGTPAARKRFEKLPIKLKHALKDSGVKSRWVTSKDSPMLSPAAVAKLRLTTEGYDFVILPDGMNVHVGLTTHVQDADAWSHRDYGRPIRDDENGMLPPKLARIMVNLAQIKKDDTILDPFCGSGTVMMEAVLATDAAHIIGSDLEDKQVVSSERNISWLAETAGIITKKDRERIRTFTSDARKIGDHLIGGAVHRVVTEGTLGPPLRGHESQAQIEKNKAVIDSIWKDTLTALHPILADGARLVICWPSFKTDNGMARVGLDAEIPALGYKLVNPLSGWDKTNGPLVYHREKQRVARRIVVLERV